MSTHTTPAAGAASPRGSPSRTCSWVQDCPRVDPSEAEASLKTGSGTACPGLSLRGNNDSASYTPHTSDWNLYFIMFSNYITFLDGSKYCQIFCLTGTSPVSDASQIGFQIPTVLK